MELWGIFMGGLIAALAGYIGHALSKDTEHAQWRRNEKLAAYQSFLEQSFLFEERLRTLAEDKRLLSMPAYGFAIGKLSLFAPATVQSAATEVELKLWQLANCISNPEGHPNLSEDRLWMELHSAVRDFQELAATDLRTPYRKGQALTLPARKR